MSISGTTENAKTSKPDSVKKGVPSNGGEEMSLVLLEDNFASS
jgi:hypothetical protein